MLICAIEILNIIIIIIINGVISFKNHLNTALMGSNKTKYFKPLLPRPGLGRKFESPMFGCFIESR